MGGAGPGVGAGQGGRGGPWTVRDRKRAEGTWKFPPCRSNGPGKPPLGVRDPGREAALDPGGGGGRARSDVIAGPPDRDVIARGLVALPLTGPRPLLS